MSSLYNTLDFKDIKRIILMFGPACNMHCRHCLQTPIKGSPSYGKVTDKVMQVIENFIRYAMRTESEAKQIMLWGGEPLLYWNDIKEIIETTDAKLHWSNTNKFYFLITTNGTLLNDEMISFFNFHKVHIAFSYDAPYPFIARDYVSDEICEKVKQLKYCEISSNPCAYNMDTLLSIRCLRAKFSSLSFDGTPFILRRTFAMPKDLYNYNWEEVKTIVRKIRIGSQLNDLDCLSIMKNFMVSVCLQNEKRNPIVPICYARRKQLSLMSNGDISVCYNKVDIIGTVEDELSDIWQKYFALIEEKYKNSECATCEHNTICDGFCLIELRDTDGKSLTCKEYRKQFWSIVKDELKNLNKPVTVEEISWFKKQEKIMDKQVKMFLQEGNRFKQEHTRLPIKQ